MVDHILGHETSLINLRRLKSYEVFFFSDHNSMKLETNNRRKAGKLTVCGN